MAVKPIAVGPGAGTEGLEPVQRPTWASWKDQEGKLWPSHQEHMDTLNPHAKPMGPRVERDRDGNLLAPDFSQGNPSTQIADYATRSARLWEYFNWAEIEREAKLRLAEARHLRQNIGTLDTLEYWCAWCAHANLSAVILDAK